MKKILIAIMFLITLFGCAIILMLAQIISDLDGGSLFGQIPIMVYLIFIVAVCVVAWALSD